MTCNVSIDFETRSTVDLSRVNPWTYSKHPTTDVICLAWVCRGKTGAWTNPKVCEGSAAPWPGELFRLLSSADTVSAFNASFELAIWENVMHERYGWPPIPWKLWRDTQAVACYLSLPPSLDALARLYGLGGKDKRGKRLINTHSKLKPERPAGMLDAQTTQSFVEYCKEDVALEFLLGFFMGPLPEQELARFQEDLRSCYLGLRLDVGLIKRAKAIAVSRQRELAEAFHGMTGFQPSQRLKVRDWLRASGVDVPDVQKNTLDLLPPQPREIQEPLDLYRAHGKTSITKLDAMLRNAEPDDRARFQTRYHGASTGRNTGTGFQPLNLPRPMEGYEPEDVVRDIGHGAELLDALYGDALDVLSKSLRYFIVPEKGHRFLAADFTSIEAVVLAMLSGEQWKIDAFAAGEPVYERTADLVHGYPAGTVTKETHPQERYVGKVCELASGYQGSVGAWRKFDPGSTFSDDEVRDLISRWRKAHPRIVLFWRSLERAFQSLVSGRVDREQVGDFMHLGRKDSWLYMEAPNGKRIWYAEPSLCMTMPPWHEPDAVEECALRTCRCRPRLQGRYQTWKAGRWCSAYTYGGKLAENACQFIAREILREAQTRVLNAEYPVVLTVYDEILTEVPRDFGSVQELVRLMEASSDWLRGWPIRATGWEGERYRK